MTFAGRCWCPMLGIVGTSYAGSTSSCSPRESWSSTSRERRSCGCATAARWPSCSLPCANSSRVPTSARTYRPSSNGWPGKDCCAMPPIPRPLALLVELTYRCPLKCPYCSNPLELARYRRELDTETWKRVLAEAAALGVVQVHFSGGEPLVRRDLAELVRHARGLDLYSNLSTGATLADQATLEQLREAGLDGLQISLLDARPDGNDWLAGHPSFDKKARAV